MSATNFGSPVALVRPITLLVSILALTACQDGELNLPFLGGDAAEETTSQTAPTGSTTEQDVEAPDVFSVTEEGLWDGRPSLGGIWVAHPDVEEPERVVIRNETTGESVVGALFRRERDNPGPALQVSSDAAEQLGMLAGAPQLLNVVALRREAVPTTPPIAAPDPDFIAAETVTPDAPAAVTETPLDAIDPAATIDPAVTPDVAPLGAPLDAMADPLVSAAAAIEAAEAEQAASN